MSEDSVLGPDPIQTAKALTDALEGMTKQLAAVKATVARGKRIIIGLAVSLVLDVALTVVVTLTAAQAHDTAAQAHDASARANATVTQLHAIQVSSCNAGNGTRAAEIQLWTHLAAVSTPPAGSTPAQAAKDRQAIAALLTYVRQVFKPRDCAKIYATR